MENFLQVGSSPIQTVLEDMEIWSASRDGFSFVISHESRSGPGFHGPPGYVASWRSLSRNTAAIRVAARPLKRLLRPTKPARPCWDTCDEKSRWGMTLGTPQA